jgi:hypothetical protein
MVRRNFFARGGRARNQYGGVPSTIASNVVTALFTTTPHHPSIIAWTSQKSWKMKLFATGATSQYIGSRLQMLCLLRMQLFHSQVMRRAISGDKSPSAPRPYPFSPVFVYDNNIVMVVVDLIIALSFTIVFV